MRRQTVEALDGERLGIPTLDRQTDPNMGGGGACQFTFVITRLTETDVHCLDVGSGDRRRRRRRARVDPSAQEEP